MATRQETAKRKQALVTWLSEAIHSGQLRPGEMAPTARDLAHRFGLSLRVVALEIQGLVEAGLLHTLPRRGTFIGRPARPSADIYLLCVPGLDDPVAQLLRMGFEDRITHHGGRSLVLSRSEAVDRRRRGGFGDLAGLLDFDLGRPGGPTWGIDRALPRAAFSAWNEDPLHADVISFDDQGGGWQATQALIAQGHRRIAFLALHPQPNPERRALASEAREIGWRAALAKAALPFDGLAFHPGPAASGPGGPVARLLALPGITAVVAADASAVEDLTRAMTVVDLPRERWPQIVTFDEGLPVGGHSSLRRPWEDVGRTAADFLWERRSGNYRGQPRLRQVPMRLVHRGGFV